MAGGRWVAGLVENKANSARPAELELAASWGWAELGKNKLSQARWLGGWVGRLEKVEIKPSQPSRRAYS